jgi:hypothetical protein
MVTIQQKQKETYFNKAGTASETKEEDQLVHSNSHGGKRMQQHHHHGDNPTQTIKNLL